MAANETQSQELTPEEYKKRLLVNHRAVLIQVLEYVYGLNDEIVTRELLSDEQRGEIDKLVQERTKLNATLLEMICQASETNEAVYDDFMESLEETLQSHLQTYIRKDGRISTDDGNRPILQKERGCIRKLRKFLVEEIYSTLVEILDLLLQHNCISRQHYNRIRAKEPHDDVRLLLDIVESRSYNHFKEFFACLRIKQPTFEPMDIETGGGVVSIDAQTSIESRNASRLEELEELVIRRYLEMSSTNFDQVLQNAIYLSKSRSIRVSIYCPNLEFLQRIGQFVANGSMRDSIEKFFNFLLGSDHSERLQVKQVFMVDFSVQEFYLKCDIASVNPFDSNSISLNHILLRNGASKMDNVLCRDICKSTKERILLKAFIFRIVNARKLTSNPKIDAFESLAGVCKDWREKAKSDSLRSTVLSEVKKQRGQIKLRYETNIVMHSAISCVTNLVDDIYIVLLDEPNNMYIWRKDIVGSESEEVTVKSESPASNNPLRIRVADNLFIASMEASEDDKGIFCINSADSSIWYWNKSDVETRNPATVVKQFSQSVSFTVSPTDQMRIALLANTNVLEMHNQSSEIIQILRLPKTIDRPLCVACNSRGNVLVSHGSNTGSLHRICMVNRNGQIVLVYGDERGDGVNQLNHPCRITLDQDDFVYVADRRNHRVLVLDKDLNLISVVLDGKSDGIGSPTWVHFANHTRRLLVAHGNTVGVYKIVKRL